MDYLIEASAAEAEAISATLAAVKARQLNGEAENLRERDSCGEAMASGEPTSTLIKGLDYGQSNNGGTPGVRLHHRAVSFSIKVLFLFILNLLL